MRMRWISVMALFWIAHVFAAQAFAAERTAWKSIAMACTPTSSTASQELYVTSGGRVKHQPGATGTISFVCPMHDAYDLGLAWYRLRLFGKPDETQNSAHRYLQAQLKYVDDETGQVFTVLETDSTLSTGNPMVEVSSPVEGFSFLTKDTHYVQITIDRPRVNSIGRTEQIPEILSVELLREPM